MPVDYIVGVATHPAARGKGLAMELIRGAFHMARLENKGAVILMPSAASYYYPMGFSFYAHQWKRSAAPEHLSFLGKRAQSAGSIASIDEWKTLASVYDRYVKGRNGWAFRDEASWKKHIGAQFCDGGYIAVVNDLDGAAGYIFYHLDGRKLIVSEMAYAPMRDGKGSMLTWLDTAVPWMNACGMNLLMTGHFSTGRMARSIPIYIMPLSQP